jgi:hypothetical protein
MDFSERERKIKETIPQNDFEQLYEWGYELLPPLKVYTPQKWFYKGINSTSEKIFLNVRVYRYGMAMYYEGRFDEYNLDRELFMQNMVKEYWKRWWLWEGCIKLNQADAQEKWIKECLYRLKIQDNYIENVDHMVKTFNNKWRGSRMLAESKQKKGMRL